MNIKQNREGSALLIVLGIMTVATITLSMLHLMANQQVHSTIIIRDRLKARMIAESGLNLAYHIVRNNFVKLENFQLTDKFSDGQYTVTSKTFSGDLDNRGQLTSIGTCGIGKSIVAVDLENCPIGGSDGSDLDDNFFEMDFDMLAGGKIGAGADFHADVNYVHANGSVTIQKDSTVSDNVTVSSTGSVTWGKEKDPPPANVTLKPNEPAQAVYPEDLETAVQAFIDFAEKNGAVYTDPEAISRDPAGGVVIYNGTEDLILHGNYNGTIIVLSGSIKINAGTILSGPDGYPSLISLSPDEIKFNGNASLYGAVIAPNSEMTLLGTASVYGPLLVGQDITGTGTADLYEGKGQGFALPPKAEAPTDKVVITAWH